MATGNLGNLVIGLILNTDKFGKGAKKARTDLFGIKAAAMDLKSFFLKGFLGTVGVSSFSAVLKKGFKALKEDMKDLDRFSGAERERVLGITTAVKGVDDAWRETAKSLTLLLLPALDKVAKRTYEISSMLTAFTGGETRSAKATRRLVESLGTPMFDKFQKEWIAAGGDEAKMAAAFKKYFGPEAGNLRFNEAFNAVQDRIKSGRRRTDFAHAGGIPGLGLGLFNQRFFQSLYNQPTPVTEASLGQISRIQSLVDSMDIAGNVPQSIARRRMGLTGGLSALEKGTAEAFSQEKRSQQQQQQLMEVKKQTKVQEKMETHLKNIDRNLKSAVISTEAANLA